MKNSVTLIGRIGKDVAIKDLKDNKVVTQFQVATEEKFKDADEVRTTTEWHHVELWDRRKLAEILTTGMLVDIEGSLHTSTWSKAIGEESVTLSKTVVRAERIIILSKKSETEAVADQTIIK